MGCFYCKHPFWTQTDLFCTKCGKKQPIVCEGTDDHRHPVKVFQEDWLRCPACEVTSKGGLPKLKYACLNSLCTFRYDLPHLKFCVVCRQSLEKTAGTVKINSLHPSDQKGVSQIDPASTHTNVGEDPVGEDPGDWEDGEVSMAGGSSSSDDSSILAPPTTAPKKTIDDVLKPSKQTKPPTTATKTKSPTSNRPQSTPPTGGATSKLSLPISVDQGKTTVRDLSPQRNVVIDDDSEGEYFWPLTVQDSVPISAIRPKQTPPRPNPLPKPHPRGPNFSWPGTRSKSPGSEKNSTQRDPSPKRPNQIISDDDDDHEEEEKGRWIV